MRSSQVLLFQVEQMREICWQYFAGSLYFLLMEFPSPIGCLVGPAADQRMAYLILIKEVHASLLISIALVSRSLEVRKRERKIKQVDTRVSRKRRMNTAGSEKETEA